MPDVDYPFAIGRDGRTAVPRRASTLRDLIEQVLFTTPGERVNRPTFGSEVSKLVFAPNSQAAAPADPAGGSGGALAVARGAGPRGGRRRRERRLHPDGDGAST